MIFPSFAEARRVQANKAKYVSEYGRPENGDWSSAEKNLGQIQQQAPKQQEEPAPAPLAVPKFNPDGSMDVVPATGANGGGYSEQDPRMKLLKQAQEGSARRELSRSKGAGEAVSSAEARQSDRAPLFESQALRKRLKSAFPGLGTTFATPSPMSAR